MKATSIDARLLWDVVPGALDTETHRDFILARVMNDGTVDDLRALRREVGDFDLRAHLCRTRGRRISRRRLRYLEAILDLDQAQVTAWIADPVRRVWDSR